MDAREELAALAERARAEGWVRKRAPESALAEMRIRLRDCVRDQLERSEEDIAFFGRTFRLNLPVDLYTFVAFAELAVEYRLSLVSQDMEPVPKSGRPEYVVEFTF